MKRSEKNNLLDFFNATPNPVSLYDAKARLLFCNQAFCDYIRIKDSAAYIGMHINDILASSGIRILPMNDDTNSTLQMFDVIRTGTPSLNHEVRIEYPDSPTMIVSNDMYPVKDNSGKVIGMLELFHSRQQEMQRVKNVAGLTAPISFDSIIGKSAAYQSTVLTAKKYADSPFNLLLTGESGAGKEMFAQAIHNYSSRSNGPFVALNCASFPDHLIESELFGYVPGAFTGASRNGQIGKFELADGGTIFLDEIGELPLQFQPKLLRVLENWMITRLGGTKQIPVDVRLIAATNRNLEQMVRDGLFREDLYYRLQILSIEIPPLRDRKEDIPLLADHFIGLVSSPEQFSRKSLSAEALQLLQAYNWPGNIRELRNVITRACILSKGAEVSADDIRNTLGGKALAENTVPGFSQEAPEAKVSADDLPSAESVIAESVPADTAELSSEERLNLRREEINAANIALIHEALDIAGGNRSKAADLIGVSRKTFYRMLEKYDI